MRWVCTSLLVHWHAGASSELVQQMKDEMELHMSALQAKQEGESLLKQQITELSSKVEELQDDLYKQQAFGESLQAERDELREAIDALTQVRSIFRYGHHIPSRPFVVSPRGVVGQFVYRHWITGSSAALQGSMSCGVICFSNRHRHSPHEISTGPTLRGRVAVAGAVTGSLLIRLFLGL